MVSVVLVSLVPLVAVLVLLGRAAATAAAAATSQPALSLQLVNQLIVVLLHGLGSIEGHQSGDHEEESDEQFHGDSGYSKVCPLLGQQLLLKHFGF